MMHVARIKDGKVQYANRWVQTERLKLEKKLGKAIFMKVCHIVVGISRAKKLRVVD